MSQLDEKSQERKGGEERGAGLAAGENPDEDSENRIDHRIFRASNHRMRLKGSKKGRGEGEGGGEG